MTWQDSESVGQSQLRAGWSTRLFSATREGLPLVPALWPVLLSHWPRATETSRERSRIATSDVYKNLNPQHPRQAGEGREDRTGYQSWSSIKGVFTQNFKRKFYGWSTDIQSIANLQNGKNTGRWWGMLWTSERRASGHLHIKTYKTNHREKSNPDIVTELFTKKWITNEKHIYRRLYRYM